MIEVSKFTSSAASNRLSNLVSTVYGIIQIDSTAPGNIFVSRLNTIAIYTFMAFSSFNLRPTVQKFNTGPSSILTNYS
jgi:hypothetical protein